DDASFTIADTLCLGDADPVPTITGDIGGTFSVNNGAIIDPVSGMLDLSSTVAGTNYQITYATNDTCPNTFSQMVHIQTSDDASFTMVDSVCVFDFNPLPSIQGTTGGTFSVDQGASISAQSGELFLATTSIGTTYTVQYITGGNCPDTATQTITVTGIADASFSYPDTLCPSGTALPTITGQTGGSFTITGGATINATTGEIDLSTISGSFATVTYALPDPCLSFSQFSILVLDDQAPDSVSLADAVGECEVILNAPTTMDNCAGMITATTTDSLVYDQPGTYTVNWTFDDGNGNQTTASQNVVVQDDTPPTVICRDLTVRVDGNGQAVITVAQIDSATTDNCMLMSLTISQDTFTLADFGQNTVSLIATDGNGNVDSCEATVTVLGTTGIWDQLQPISFDVYPNPAQDIVHVNWESQEFGEVKLRVFNQMGQEVYQANHYKVSDQLKASIDLSLLPTGMYFVQVRHGEKVGRQQLVKR
ncbi:MAG: T9SS type A sorting domain-containing protein, partial [Bacteroidota bacterium]